VNRALINFVAFQLGWFSCVLGAANGVPLIGLAVASMVVLLHLLMARDGAAELRLLVIAVLIGLVFDSVLASLGWIRYPNGVLVPGLAPYWILAMWAIFATTLNVSMSWLRGRLVLAALMGGIFGPLSYQAGGRLGGLAFAQETAAMVALGLGWALIMPLLVLLAQRYDGVGEAVAPPLGQVTQGERS
jgi:hypothetical protein